MKILKYLLHGIFLLCLLVFSMVLLYVLTCPVNAQTPPDSLEQIFAQASQEFDVPTGLLKTLCYMEGNLSMHNGSPSSDNGFGCMHLVKNDHADTLDAAASLLHVSTNQLKNDMKTNIRGGAAILRKDVLQLSPNHTLPSNLGGWYGAIAAYSNATTRQSAEMYADEAFTILNQGFTAPSNTGEIVSLKPQKVSPDKKTADALHMHTVLPRGCVNDGNTDYPGAIDCLLDPDTYDCNSVANTVPCTYEEANRPGDLPVNFIVIHDVQGPLPFAFSVFHDPTSLVSIHYIVNTDGTVYQMVPEKDVAYHAGNYWYNQRSIGIEHTSFQESGFTWYSAGEYLGSAKLTAYLAQKYAVPLDHDHIVSHGTIPPPTLKNSPNHLDPGPYWQWDYYFSLIHQQGVAYPTKTYNQNVISIHPQINFAPFTPNGTAYSSDNIFSYLYNGPGTKYPLIPSSAPITTNRDVTNNIEPDLSYYYQDKVPDTAGSGMMLYHIWYGEHDNITPPSINTVASASNNTSLLDNPLMPLIGASSDKPVITSENWFANAKEVWLAVPENAVKEGSGTPVEITSAQNSDLPVYGMPINNNYYIIGNAPQGAIFVSGFTQTDPATNALWYEINYNHRQAWVPASEIKIL